MEPRIAQKAVQVVPSERQKRFMENPFYAFVHFSPNTYTGKEWGDGTEDPAIFNPVDLDCDQWVEAVKSAGMTGLVLTAKHHDGFCLWQSKYTEHCVKNSPWKNGKGDVVREAAEACRRGGIRFGFYLSPWDRNCKLYGTDAYNEYYRAQLTELLTQYGEIFYVWFDGACGEGPNGRKQVYDFNSYIELIRKYQPNACIFNDHGPDIRWVGNESGSPRYEEWAVVPSEFGSRCVEQQVLNADGGIPDMYNTWQDIGSDAILPYAKGLCFLPAEVDMSIRPGWFYHPSEEPHSLERLVRTYMTSVGGNTSFNLNVPPMPNGKFDPHDVARLSELGRALNDIFAREATPEIAEEAIDGTRRRYRVTLPAEMNVKCVELTEDMTKGQRVSRFQLVQADDMGCRNAFYEGTTVGFKRLCPLNGRKMKTFDVMVLAARAEPNLKIRVYA